MTSVPQQTVLSSKEASVSWGQLKHDKNKYEQAF
jgi:hypothetical protein